jgi:hypothetical protein
LLGGRLVKAANVQTFCVFHFGLLLLFFLFFRVRTLLAHIVHNNLFVSDFLVLQGFIIFNTNLLASKLSIGKTLKKNFLIKSLKYLKKTVKLKNFGLPKMFSLLLILAIGLLGLFYTYFRNFGR